MKKKIIQLYKDTQHYQSKHPFFYTFTLGAISLIFLSIVAILVLYILPAIISLFLILGISIVVLLFSLPVILLAGLSASKILGKWTGL